MITTDTSIRYLKGIGEARAKTFAKLGVEKIKDLLEFYPRAYEDRTVITKLAEAEPYTQVTTVLKIITDATEHKSKNGLSYIKAYAEDDSAEVLLTFFNQTYLKTVLLTGRTFRVTGKISQGIYSLEMVSPVIEAVYPGKKLPGIVTVYPLVKGLTGNIISNAVKSASSLFSEYKNVLPDAVIKRYGLMNKSDAMKEMHFPFSPSSLAKAKETLAFEELLIFQLAMRMLKKNQSESKAFAMSYKGSSISKFFEALPFSLTNAQKRVIKEILDDLCRDTAMARIVIGDVGSGKTVIAAAAIYFTVMQKKGCQCAFMAPTEILANQHFGTLNKLFSNFGFRIELLTGSMTAKEKNRIKKSLAAGETDIIVGTHALIQSDVIFNDLELMITDEQHRFGVAQRSGLADKGKGVHTLVMSATPIPRTLSLVLYGDMDVSIVDELPPGRQKTETYVIDPEIRNRAYEFIRKQVASGFQAYIICPLVEESETLDRKAAESVFKTISEEVFPEIKCGLIHGKLNAKAKDEVMRSFKDGETKILVSTTVIEVGVDVPDASVILIENAECFGLSQLHQLRGRIGRGKQKSYCILVSGDKSKKAETRLDIFKRESDGFKIANEDLALRGPGDFFGLRQSGKLIFKTASLADIELIEKTKEVCADAVDGIDTKEYAPLKKALGDFFNNMISKNMVN